MEPRFLQMPESYPVLRRNGLDPTVVSPGAISIKRRVKRDGEGALSRARKSVERWTPRSLATSTTGLPTCWISWGTCAICPPPSDGCGPKRTPLALGAIGEVSDSTQLTTSLDIGPDITPRAAMADKGYDAKSNRAACRERGIIPVLPYRSNTKNKPSFFPKRLYRGRARIEPAIGPLKRFKRIAMRCEKTAESFAAFVAFAGGLILVKSVHRA